MRTYESIKKNLLICKSGIFVKETQNYLNQHVEKIKEFNFRSQLLQASLNNESTKLNSEMNQPLADVVSLF